jgi:hypothetical protein
MSLTDGLIGAWVPALGSTAGVLLDRSAYSNHGTLQVQTPAETWQASRYGPVMFFGATDNNRKVVAQTSETINAAATARWSWCLWLKPVGAQYFAPYYHAIGSYRFTTYQGHCSMYYAGQELSRATSAWSNYGKTNDWNFISLNWLGSTSEWFINGVQISTSNIANITSGGSVITIGLREDNFGETPHQNAELTWRKRTLAGAEWRQLYQLGPGGWLARKRRRVYSIPAGPAFKAAWATRATTIAGVLQ